MNEELKLSDAGLSLIKTSEGLRLTVYRDVAGFATIGYGHKILPTESFSTIVEAEAGALLETDSLSAAQAVIKQVTVQLTQGQFDALTDFVFNLGAQRLAESTLLKLLNAGQYAQVPTQLCHTDDEGHVAGWVYAGGEIEPALVIRRQAEIALWNS